MRYLILLLLILTGIHLQAQTPEKSTPDTTNHVYWSSARKLKISDFKPKTDTTTNGATYFYIYYEYNLNDNDSTTTNFNNKVVTYFDKTTSWIDTSYIPPPILLAYVQTCFDISEIYTRKFRQYLGNRRKEITTGFAVLTEIEKQVETEKDQMIAHYVSQSKFGMHKKEQARWRAKVNKELKALEAFAADYPVKPN